MNPSDSKIQLILSKVDPANQGQLIKQFAEARIQDVLLPFPESGMGLPSHMRRDKEKLNRFNEAQRKIIQSTGDGLDEALNAPDGYKHHFHLNRHVILQHCFNMSPGTGVSLWNEETCEEHRLGRGGFGRVFKVQMNHGTETDISREGLVAMKYLIRPRQPPHNSGDDLPRYWRGITHIGETVHGKRYVYPYSQQTYFQREVDILRRIREISDSEAKWAKLKDNHIIKIRASFTDPDGFGILISPVASYSLENMLRDLSRERTGTSLATHWDSSDTETVPRKDQLLGFIGCLASSVLFLHRNHIRHKDLKTGNVLVYRSQDVGTELKICVCDFATATDYSDDPDSKGLTEDDVVRPRTRHVDSPEMLEGGPRTISEDMWHLGCIMLAILLVLKGKTEEDMFEVAIPDGEDPTFPGLLTLHEKRFPRKDLGNWLDGLKSESVETVEVVIDWVKDLLLAEGPNFSRITSEVLVTRIGEQMSNGHHALAGDCCTEIVAPSLEFANDETAIQAPIETASLTVPGRGEPRQVWAGTISIFNTREPSLDRFLNVQGQKTHGRLGATDIMEAWLPVTGMRISHNERDRPNQVTVEWSDFEQHCERPGTPPANYERWYWLGFNPSEPNWKLEVSFQKTKDAELFIDILVFMHQYADGNPVFQQIDDTQAFAVQPVNKEHTIEALSLKIWPVEELEDHAPAVLNAPKLSKILLIRRGIQSTGRGQSAEYDTYFMRDKMNKLDLQLRGKAITLRGLETVTYKGTEPRTGMKPGDRRPPSLTRGSRAVPISEGSLLQDLEIRLPDDYFHPGEDPGINMSSITHSSESDGFCLLMNCLLGQGFQWLCTVQDVKQVQHFRADIEMGCCLLLLWNSHNTEDEGNKQPWLFLREMNAEIGRAKWWCGQVEKINKIRPEEKASKFQLRHYQQSDAVGMDMLCDPQKDDTCELCIKFYRMKECSSFLINVYEHDS